jgi:hypothetical protein
LAIQTDESTTIKPADNPGGRVAWHQDRLPTLPLPCRRSRGLTVTYDGVVVGQFFVDLIVEQALLTASAWDEGHRAQCVNYLKASG